MKPTLFFAVAGAAALLAATASADLTNGTPDFNSQRNALRAATASTDTQAQGMGSPANAAMQQLRNAAATSHASAAPPADARRHPAPLVAVATTDVAHPELPTTATAARGAGSSSHGRSTNDLAARRASFFRHAHVHAMKL